MRVRLRVRGRERGRSLAEACPASLAPARGGTDARPLVPAHRIRCLPCDHAGARPAQLLPQRQVLAPLARLASAAACARTLHQDAARRTDSGVVGATMRMRARQVAKEAEELEEEEQEDVRTIPCRFRFVPVAPSSSETVFLFLSSCSVATSLGVMQGTTICSAPCAGRL